MKFLTWFTTYTLIILAELGDKTQIATLLLASNNPRKKWVVFFSGALALTTCVFLEVTVGRTISRLISQDTINRLTGVVFLVVGLGTLYKQYAQAKRWKMLYGFIPKLNVEKESEHVSSGEA